MNLDNYPSTPSEEPENTSVSDAPSPESTKSAKTGRRRTSLFPPDEFLYAMTHPLLLDAVKIGRSVDPEQDKYMANRWWPGEHGFTIIYQAKFKDAQQAYFRAMTMLGLENRRTDGWVQAAPEEAIAVLRLLQI